jgi:hypothetical protein
MTRLTQFFAVLAVMGAVLAFPASAAPSLFFDAAGLEALKQKATDTTD